MIRQKENKMFNYFQCITNSRKVLGSLELDQFLSKIKNGDEHLGIIEKARQNYSVDKSSYTTIKKNQLPCYALNFRFDGVRRNSKILESTGHIYIDVDNQTDIDLLNPLIFASWLSLSGNGRGILVNVDNVTPSNFKDTYNDISKELGIKADEGACKPSQPNVLSFDPNVYINHSSLIYKAIDKEEIPHYSTINNKNPPIGTVLGTDYSSLRFDNLDELIENVEFNGEVIHDYRTKVRYSEVYVNNNGIKKGERNIVLCGYAYQLRALNKEISHFDLNQVLKDINAKYCHPPLPLSKILSITKWAMNLINIQPNLNKERRFVYSPDYDLTTTQKKQLNMAIINKDRVEESKRKIEKTIDDWDFEEDGKITQRGLSKTSGMNIKTIQKYYNLFKSRVERLNLEFKKK
jgi:hypothetical protein